MAWISALCFAVALGMASFGIVTMVTSALIHDDHDSEGHAGIGGAAALLGFIGLMATVTLTIHSGSDLNPAQQTTSPIAGLALGAGISTWAAVRNIRDRQ